MMSGKGAAPGEGRDAAPKIKSRSWKWNNMQRPKDFAGPVVHCSRSFSYIWSGEIKDLLCPAWSVRRLKDFSLPIDLSLERGLAALQCEDGSFALTAELLALMGVPEVTWSLSVVQRCGAEDSSGLQVAGTLLVLKTAAVYKGRSKTPRLQSICKRAEDFCCSLLSMTPEDLWWSLQHCREEAATGSLPPLAEALLRKNFAAGSTWGSFDINVRLMPAETRQLLANNGGVMCPRFVLVDLASYPLSPWEVVDFYPIYSMKGLVFVGCMDDDRKPMSDVLRQGRQLEAALVENSWTEEDRILTELQLPGLLVCYSAAPDAIEPDGEALAPLEAGNEAYQSAGYELSEEFDSMGQPVRLWQADGCQAPPSATYLEVKKTTHLGGRPGQYKRLKFWLQAALMNCSRVVVAMTDGSQDGEAATAKTSLPTELLEREFDGIKIWAGLTDMLKWVISQVADMDGPWVLKVVKEKGMNEAVRLSLKRGWEGSGVDEAASMVLFSNVSELMGLCTGTDGP